MLSFILASDSWLLTSVLPLCCFRDFASLDAARANLHAQCAALRTLHADGLQVRIKATASTIVRVRDIITKLRRLATDFATFCHDYDETSEQ